MLVLFLPRPLSYDCRFVISHSKFSSHIVYLNSRWLALVHTLALIVAYMDLYTIVSVFSYAQHTHSCTVPRVIHVANNKPADDNVVQTFALTHIYSICFCTCLDRPLIVFQFMYQSFFFLFSVASS